MRCPHCGHTIRFAQPLTKRQAELYRYIAGYQWAHSYAPTFEEIAEAFNYKSLATVHEHLSHLEKKGWIYRDFNLARGTSCLVTLDELRPEEATLVMDEIARQAVQMETQDEQDEAEEP